ncbi:ankyrin, partial [Coniochaeta ligniaria NRRL 30616]
MVQFLVNNNANAIIKNQVGETALDAAVKHAAVKHGHGNLLLSNGAVVDAEDNHGNTPLHWAASLGHHTCTRLLLTHGARVQAENNEGATPLHMATTRGDALVVQLLLENGARHDAKGPDGETALYWLLYGSGATFRIGPG